MKSHPLNIAAFAIAMGLGLIVQAQPSGEANMNSREGVNKTFQESKARCDAMSGNAKSICMVEATGNQKSSLAEMDARNKPSAAAQRRAMEVRADADYDLAKQRCQDQMGSARDSCLKDAKTARTTARANARTPMNTTGSADTSKMSGGDKGTKGEGPNEATEKREAQYKMDTEKCESMTGAAKTNCQAQAKTRAGK